MVVPVLGLLVGTVNGVFPGVVMARSGTIGTRRLRLILVVAFVVKAELPVARISSLITRSVSRPRRRIRRSRSTWNLEESNALANVAVLGVGGTLHSHKGHSALAIDQV